MKVIPINKSIKQHHNPFFFCLTWFFVFSSAHSADMAVDLKAGETKKPEQAEIKKGDTQWAMGIGLGVLDYHLYPGARQSNRLIFPAPYFTYRSPKFEVDRGIKSFIYNSEAIIIDISADFALPVDSDETLARKGMPDLDFVLQLGPSLEFMLNDKSSNYFDARFELPVRVAFAVDPGSIENIGYLIEPRFTLKHQRLANTGLSHKATFGLKFATQDFNAYYYDVAPAFATATRAEYKSDAGFGGSFVNYRISYKTNDFIYWAFIRYQSLRGAKFEDSPLVLQNDYYFFGAGFAWIFAQSL